MNIGLKKEQIDSLIKYLNMDFIQIKKEFSNIQNTELINGIKEISELNEYIKEMDLSEYVQFSATLARGQEYYTGTIFEVYQKNGEIKSSIGGGGRYDNMIGNFIGNGREYPAVGISFGLDVIFEILKSNTELSKNNTELYIIPMQNKVQALKIANILRKQNINVDIEMNETKLRKSMEYANKEKIPYVVILGEDELKQGKVLLKDMENGEQQEVDIWKIGENIKKD